MEAWGWWRGVFEEAGETGFVFEEETLVAGVDVDCLYAAICVDPDGLHEAEGIFDSSDDALVLFFDGRCDDVPKTPVERGVEVC